MDKVYDLLTARALAAHKARSATSPTSQPPSPTICALAGPPGSGKSTVAAEVVKRINASTSSGTISAVVPMDGFHYSRAYLDGLPNREEAYARRGVHWTFDAAGVVAAVKKLRQERQSDDGVVSLPGFDHAAKDPVEGAVIVDKNMEILVLEGNWILYNELPWSEIPELVHETWFLDVKPDLARDRIAKRHVLSGIEHDWEAAVRRAEGNDLINGEDIRQRLIKPDVIVESVEVDDGR